MIIRVLYRILMYLGIYLMFKIFMERMSSFLVWHIYTECWVHS